MRFVGGIRTPVATNATWPFISLEVSSDGLRVRLRARFLEWAFPGLDEELYLWNEVRRAEPARTLPIPGGAGVRFETDRGAFVFWSFTPAAVLAAVERVAPAGVVRRGKPRMIWLRP